MSERAIIDLKGLSKRFGDTAAVDAVDLQIREGEFFALLGPSGCGKTTLLRMLAGLEMPSDGSIMIDDQDMSLVPANKRPVNMVFQSYAVFPHMSVLDNVGYGLKIEGVGSDERNQRAREALELVKLSGFENRKPDQLSGGQRQRVALARALVKRPKVLLLDEPLSALDAKLREQMQLELVNLQESVGITFVVVTHDQDEALSMADRIAVMDGGRIQQIAPPSELYEFPKTRFVADFIGSVNLVDGIVKSVSDGSIELECAGFAEPLRVNHGAEALTVGQSVQLAIRPEKLSISSADDGTKDRNQISGEVEEITYLGDISTYHVRVGEGLPMIKVTAANRLRSVERPFTWGDKVTLSWEENSGVVLTS